MFRYYGWAIAEQALSHVPFGPRLYSAVGTVANRRRRGRSSNFGTSFPLIRRAKELLWDGATVVDIGTGWHHHDAFLLYLIGDYRTYLFDVADKARLVYIKNYLNHLLENIELVAHELDIRPERIHARLDPLLDLRNREALYEACNFTLCIVPRPVEPFLPERTADFMISNCVLNHIDRDLIIPELCALRDILKDDGHMYSMIGHEDHWGFHDRSVNRFNYYRFSNNFYRRLFETKCEFHNRLVKSEWSEIFEHCGLDVAEYYGKVTERSLLDIARLPQIDERFARYPLEELAITHSYVLTRRKPVTASPRVGAAAERRAAGVSW
jgi:hypothetical protein